MARSLLDKWARGEEAQSNALSQRLVTIADPANAASEVYRTLRTRLRNTQLADGRQPKVILVTSPGSMEGKSTTCANLGVVLAQGDKDVLLVDCNFREPTIHEIFALSSTWGIVDVLSGERSLQDVWQEPIPRLKAVPVGSAPPNATELLSSRRFARVVDRAREEFDYVLLDSPPTQQASDPEVLATQSDGVLLVLDVQSTPKETLRQSVRGLEAVGANVLGTVMNNVPNGKAARF